jgi:hypothetical protein
MAFTPCTNLLAQSLATPCEEPRIKGYEAIGLLINRDDVDWSAITVDASNPRIITSLPLVATKKAAVIYNNKKSPLPFDGTQTQWNPDANAFDKTLQFYFEGIGGAASKTAESLKDGNFVGIVERASKYDVGSFQVFGYQRGLSAGNEGGAIAQTETDGHTLITMTTQEPWFEIEWNAGTYVLTKAAFKALQDAAM